MREWGDKRENKGWFSNTIRVCILIPIAQGIKMLSYARGHTSYATRYCSKLLLHQREYVGGRFSKEKKSTKTKGRVLPYGVVNLIARDLHHVDLVSVSQASPALRTLFFGRTDDEVHERLSLLHEASCEGEKKTHCELCDTQICYVSQSPSQHLWPGPSNQLHRHAQTRSMGRKSPTHSYTRKIATPTAVTATKTTSVAMSNIPAPTRSEPATRATAAWDHGKRSVRIRTSWSLEAAGLSHPRSLPSRCADYAVR